MEQEGCPRRSVSSNRLGMGQTLDLMIKATYQDASVTTTYPQNVQKRRRPQKKNIIYLKESCYHRIKYTAANFLAVFMWKKPLNNKVLATVTHRKPRTVPDGIGTQVRI